MDELAVSALVGVGLTVAVYYAASRVYRRFRLSVLNPVLVSIVALIGLLWVAGIDYEVYNRGGSVLSFFLGPAVVALGVPLYLQLEELARRGKGIVVALLAGSMVGILSGSLTAWLLGASNATVYSLVPRSVTTPIAIAISEEVGGIPSLTAALVIASGVLGAVAGPPLLRRAGIRSRRAFGLAMGAAAHGIGTARAAEEGTEAAAGGGLALGIMGVLTSVLAPLLLALLSRLGLIP